MADGYVSGGGNLLTISDAINSSHVLSGTTYAIWDFEFTQLGEVQVTRDSATGYYGFTIDSIQVGQELSTLLETWAPASATGEVEEYVYTNGGKTGGATGAAPDLLAVNYGAPHTESGEIPVTGAVIKFQLDAGAYTESNGTMIRHNVTMVGQKIKASVALLSAMFCSAVVTGEAMTLLVNTGGRTQWFAPPA
jgi:hypothetical protein